jgi:RimJ/RimL family protein N-acetyltransferase
MTQTNAMPNDITLRAVQEGDLPILFEHQLDPHARQMAAFPGRDRDAFMAHWAKAMADETTILRTVLLRGMVVGSIVYWQQSGKGNVGYWIDKDHWGRGIATAALAQFLHIVKARPLQAYVAKHNLGSIRVLQKCGFTVAAEQKLTGADGSEGEEFLMMLGVPS